MKHDAPSHVTTLLPRHSLAAGLPLQWNFQRTELYGEPYHIPTPVEVIFEERWGKGEHFRSGCVWKVGQGRVFYCLHDGSKTLAFRRIF